MEPQHGVTMQLYPDPPVFGPPVTSESLQTTGFLENYQAGLGQHLTENAMISPLIPSVVESERDKKLEDYRKSGALPQKVFDFYEGDIDGLVDAARNEYGLTDIPDRVTYYEQLQEEYALYRNMTAKTREKANWAGKLGSFVGTVHGAAVDVPNLISMFAGVGGLSTGASIAQTALKSGIIDMAGEAVRVPVTMSYTKKIGTTYSPSQAFVDVVAAGLGSTALTALTATAGKALGKLASPNDVITVQHALDVLEPIAKDNPGLEPTMHILRNSDPKANLGGLLEEQTSWEKILNNRRSMPDEALQDMAEKAALEEEAFYKRVQPKELEAPPEGGPRGTPKKDARTSKGPDDESLMVVKERPANLNEFDSKVYDVEDAIRAIEECG